MLRVSALTTGTEVDLQGIDGDAEAAAEGIRFGAELMRFAESLASRDEAALTSARDRLHGIAGPEVLVDAAGVGANFQRMVRIADSMGIPVDDMENELGKTIRDELNLTRFASAANSGVENSAQQSHSASRNRGARVAPRKGRPNEGLRDEGIGGPTDLSPETDPSVQRGTSQPRNCPPLTCSVWPVTCAASSLARYSAQSAMSSGVAMRPSGRPDPTASISCSVIP